ncbi:MAG: hypothetical protein SH809_15475 [Rhodothermales bacterium]|nr:hypothetical protein [Rhodothermales bacterium]
MHRLLSVILAISLAACSASVGANDEVDDARIQQRDADDVQQDPYATDTTFVRGDSLIVKVGYSGGCQNHFFRIVSEVSPIASPLPAYDLMLIHDANGDSCEAYIQEERSFDLVPLRTSASGIMRLFLTVYGSDTPLTPALEYRY